jgi:hypothetical protein
MIARDGTVPLPHRFKMSVVWNVLRAKFPFADIQTAAQAVEYTKDLHRYVQEIRKFLRWYLSIRRLQKHVFLYKKPFTRENTISLILVSASEMEEVIRCLRYEQLYCARCYISDFKRMLGSFHDALCEQPATTQLASVLLCDEEILSAGVSPGADDIKPRLVSIAHKLLHYGLCLEDVVNVTQLSLEDLICHGLENCTGDY